MLIIFCCSRTRSNNKFHWDQYYCTYGSCMYMFYPYTEFAKFKAATGCFKIDDDKIQFAGFACGTRKNKKFCRAKYMIVSNFMDLFIKKI